MRRTLPIRRSPRQPYGFTLVEILIVVAILGILAAIVVPQFTAAAQQTRENSIKMDLYRIREQLELYKEHHGKYPDLATFTEQLTMASNKAGQTAAPGTAGFTFGPYIQRMPPNAANGRTDVTDGAAGSSGWYYNAATGEFRANDSVASRAW